MWKQSAALFLAFASWQSTRAGDMAEEILMATHKDVAVHSVEIRQTVEDNARVLVDGKPMGGLQKKTQTSTIEIDARKGIVRLATRDSGGEDVVILRKGKNIAMKIGSGPWTPPKGAYSRMGDQLGNPFACPLPKKGATDSPRWTTVGSERRDGVETTVIETVGDTANQYAAQRMREGLTSVFPDAKTRPAVEVLAYKSRHWIDARNGRRLRVEQTSHVKMTMPGTGNMAVDTNGKTTAVYSRYDNVVIQVPAEARRILDPS